MQVFTKYKKLNIFKEIRVITLSLIITSQLITHQPLETTRICLMEVECSGVQDECKTISKNMMHRVSRDNNIRAATKQTIQAR